MLTSLRRFATVVAASAITIGTGAGVALAFPSGNNPGRTGPNDIEWTGQGADSVSPNGTGACSASQEPNGQPANTPYLYWVFTTDGGSVSVQPTDPPPLPVLNLGGSGSGIYNFDSSSSSNSVKFITPYFDLGSLTASANFNVLTPGNGSWNLVISHGCAAPNAPPQAQAPTVTKDAAGAYTTTYGWNVTKSVDNKELDLQPGQSGTANYTVTVTSTGSSNSNVVVSGKIDVNNPNPTGDSVTASGIADQLSDGTNCNVDTSGGLTLSPGDNYFPYTCSLDASTFNPNGSLTNQVTVNWASQTLADGSQLAAGNASFTTQPINFQQNVVDNCVTASDPAAPAGSLGQVCAGNSPQTFTYPVTYTGGTDSSSDNPPGTCTDHQNIVTLTANDQNNTQVGGDSADVKVCVGADLTVKKDATPSFTRTYKWNISKGVIGPSTIDTPQGTPATADYKIVVTNDGGTDSAWQVKGTVTVANPNDWEAVKLASSQGLVDSIDNRAAGDTGSCTFDNGDPSGTVIPKADNNGPGQMQFPYTCTYSQAPSQSAFTNTATASWDQGAAYTAHGSADGTATGDFANVSPKIVDGSVAVNDTQIQGGFVTFVHYYQPNPFEVDYPVTYSGDPAGTCTDHQNTATFTTDDTGTTGSASADVKVCVGADLSVSKNANPSFSRTYQWSIAKQGDKTTIDPGGTVTYSVTATETGFKDGGWQVSGSVHVANPNDWESITLNGLTDAIQGEPNASCSFTGTPAGTVLAPAGTQGSSADFPYTCTYSAAPASASQTNAATAGWDKGAASTPDNSAQGTASWVWGSPTTTTNRTIHVTDSQGGALGTVTASDSQPFTSKTFTYSKTFAPPSSSCATVNNIATITETGQQAKFAVQNCNSGALTMGYWQNKNGQAIISAASQAALQTWLKSFGPVFSDAPSTGIAGYFTTVFNAANASGTGAPMLKAQMLATALDVYFSDPSLGGNKIGAQNPIGGLKVNISSWSAAFGGATSMTVTQMLQYAGSQATAGGASFYGGNKTTTTTAITAFNAVNNQQVSGP